jgi:hypothetical protein
MNRPCDCLYARGGQPLILQGGPEHCVEGAVRVIDNLVSDFQRQGRLADPALAGDGKDRFASPLEESNDLLHRTGQLSQYRQSREEEGCGERNRHCWRYRQLVPTMDLRINESVYVLILPINGTEIG